MNNPFEEARRSILLALDAISDPISGQGLVKSGRISGLAIDAEGCASFTIEAPGDGRAHIPVRDAAEAAAAAVPGVTRVLAALTAAKSADDASVTRVRKGASLSPQAQAQAQPPQRVAEGPAGVAAVIAIASAKGGVGKSTVAVNLACALAALGLKTGLLDADVYGPSAPTLLGLVDAQPRSGPGGKLIPIPAFGLKTMSIGYLVDVDAPMIWRGPMATSAIRQMLDDVAWAPLDVLVLDMPPGTGDIQLTIAQRLPLAGAVIVSTPQELALADVRRGIAMFERTHVPILGVVENMAWLEAPGGKRLHPFGEGGARRTAEALGAPFLGELPLDVALRESGDRGAPLVAAQPGSMTAKRFLALAEDVLANMNKAMKPPPVIRVV